MPIWVWKENMKGGARPGSGRKPTLIDERRALSLHKQGVSMREIAERFGVDIQVIKYFFKKQRRLANDNGN
jgi:transposase